MISNKLGCYSVFGFTLRTSEDLRLLPVTSDLAEVEYVVSRDQLPGKWNRARNICQSLILGEDGKPDWELWQLGNEYILHYPSISTFDLTPSNITCYSGAGILNETVNYLLLSGVLSTWLEFQGVPVLHGSAVIVDDGVVGLLAHSGNGKSSLAAAMTKDGYPLLTDDILAIESLGERFVAHPGHPYVRLWPPEAQHFLGHYEDLELVDPRMSKRWVPVGASGLGSFCESTLPLKCLYILERYDLEDGKTKIQIQSISLRDAVIELLRYSFEYSIVEAAGLQPRRIDFFSRLVGQVPLRRIKYPSGLERLPRVRDAILEDIQKLG